jgi:hypothetical protein
MTAPSPLQSAPLSGLIDLYRNPNHPLAGRAATEILSRFERYLQKWTRLLLFGRWDHKDKELKHFLQMMGSVDIEKTAQILCLRLKAYERVDIEQEVRVVFLHTAVTGKSIRLHFRYSLQKRLVQLLKDPLVYQFGQHVPLSDLNEGVHPTADIDEAWVAGFTCGPGFDELTPDERKILQLCKHYGLTLEQTAASLGIGVATVGRVIRKAKRVLAVHYLG